MVRVFISYRTADTANLTGRLYDRLRGRYGTKSVFRDKDSLEPGDRWKTRVIDEVRRSDALLVVIDERWINRFFAEVRSGEEAQAARKVLDQVDWVQVEIETALSHDVEIIPILTGGVSLPEAAMLPTSIASLVDRQALVLDDNNFDDQYRELVRKLESVEPRGSVAARLFRRYSRRSFRLAAVAATVLGVASSVIAIAQFLGNDDVDVMTGRFNIAVARLEPSGDSELESRLALDVGNGIVTGMTSSSLDPDNRSFLVWGPAKVGAVGSADAAAELAEQLNADLLIYGEIAVDGFGTPTASIRAHTGEHNDRAPWPIDFSQAVNIDFNQQSAVDGSLADDPSLVAVALTMDGLASLLADNLVTADERFRLVEDLLSEGGDPASVAVHDRQVLSMASAMRAWALLVEAGFKVDPELVVEAERPALLAKQLDVESELAEIVSIQVDYMTTMPPRSGVVVDCDLGDIPEPPNGEEVRTLIDRTTAFRRGATEVGEIQALGILGRLSIALQLAGDRQTDHLADAISQFEQILARTGDDPALRFWRSDAHRWLGTIGTFSAAVAIDEPVGHFVAAARIDSPVWRARDQASAGLAHRCRDDGDPVQAICYFLTAAQSPIESEAELYASAAKQIETEFGASCPPNWEPTG